MLNTDHVNKAIPKARLTVAITTVLCELNRIETETTLKNTTVAVYYSHTQKLSSVSVPIRLLDYAAKCLIVQVLALRSPCIRRYFDN